MTPSRLAANISGTPSKGRIYALHGVTDNAASLSDISARWSSDYEVVMIDALESCLPFVNSPSNVGERTCDAQQAGRSSRNL